MSAPPKPRWILLLACALFWGLASPQLDLPGLHNDEAQEAGLQAMQILRGQPIDSFREAGVPIAGRVFPLMVQDYIGAVNVYLAIPFVAVFGATAAALRWMTLGLGVLALVLTYFALEEAVSPAAASAGVLLLAANPSFVFWGRQGVYVSSATLVFWLAALWAGVRWAKHGGWRAAGVMGLLCGLGVYAKLLSVWIFGGFAAAIAIVNLGRWWLAKTGAKTEDRNVRTWPWPRQPARGEAAACAIGGALGVSPMVIYNLLSGGTLLSITENLSTSYYGVDNADILQNLAARLAQFRAVLAGRDHLWYLGGSFGNPHTEWALAFAIAGLMILSLGRRVPFQRGALFPLAFLFAFLQTAFTVSGLFPTHFAIFTPLPAIILGVGTDALCRLAGRVKLHQARIARWAPAIAFAPALLLVGRDIWVDVNYHRALRHSGGQGPHSDAVYRLEEFLSTHPPEGPIVAMDWGFAPQLRYLSSGTLSPVEVFGYSWETDAGFPDRVAGFLDDPDSLYVFHWPQETFFPRRDAFGELADARGLAVQTVTDVSRRDGAPIFQIVRAAGP